MQLAEHISKKWGPVLDHPELEPIKDSYRRAVTALCLENVEQQYQRDRGQVSMLSEATPTNQMGLTGTIDNDGNPAHADINFADPVLISMVRRAMPQLVAYDVCGVQPMNGPTGLIFALRARAGTQAGAEQFYNEPDTSFSGVATATTDTASVPGLLIASGGGANTSANVYSTGVSSSTLSGEGDISNEMSFSIEKVSVVAGTRALKGAYSMELAQDLRAVHGLDAEAELANILSAELLSEINREVIRTIYINAKVGADQGNVTNAGNFDLDTDSNGRWMVEKFKGLMMQIERDANGIARDTRRGKGNIIMTSSDVASALQMAGVLDYTPALNNNLNVDESSTTFAGVLNGRYRVYVDPFAALGNAAQFYTVGYKGASPMDAGLFYCPYVPLQMVRAVDEASFQPKIAFKTRYGLVANPFAEGLNAGAGRLAENNVSAQNPNLNTYYRKVRLANLM